nr:unnamed protein product [Digitaria exilis]
MRSLSLGNRTTHRNLCPLASSPAASSAVCSVESVPPLPKHTYRTDLSGCSSSHRRQLLSSSASAASLEPDSAGGYTPWWDNTSNAAMASCSMASKVFTMKPSARRYLLASSTTRG